MPVLGICAGMIMLSNTANDRIVGKTNQPLLDILDIKLERNSFGRQRESFESDISMNSINISKFNGVFIRAPSVSDVGSDVEVLSKFNERIVAVKKGNVIGTAFHPELTEDTALHKYFINLVNTSKN
jgi:5'-phosphate synthase pdxT subunit